MINVSQMVFFLGYCPACNAEDSIDFVERSWNSSRFGDKKVLCTECNREWESLSLLCNRGANHRLVPVHIDVLNNEVRLPHTRRATDIPCAEVVNATFYCALGILFNLEMKRVSGEQDKLVSPDIQIVNTNTPGTYEGCAELRLLVFGNSKICHDVIMVYLWFLNSILIDGVQMDGESYGRGLIVKLSTNEIGYVAKVQCLLWIVLKREMGERFANTVFDKMGFEIPLKKTMANLQTVYNTDGSGSV